MVSRHGLRCEESHESERNQMNAFLFIKKVNGMRVDINVEFYPHSNPETLDIKNIC